MKIFIILCLSALFLQVSFGSEVHQVSRPTKLTASIGGFLGESFSIELQKNMVVYLHNPQTFTSGPGTTKTEIQVDAERWKAFRQALDEAQVWKWKKEYVDHKILDGTVWSFVVSYPDAAIETHGSNAYPDRKEFEKFRSAVSALLGGKDFK